MKLSASDRTRHTLLSVTKQGTVYASQGLMGGSVHEPNRLTYLFCDAVALLSPAT
jgi:hypothetical protein